MHIYICKFDVRDKFNKVYSKTGISKWILTWFFLIIFYIAVVIQKAVSQDIPKTDSAQCNVLLMISDDQGLDAGCYGNRYVQTPNMDRLASHGIRFTHAFAVVSSCSPSRSTLFTGMYNHSNGQYGLAHGAHNQRTKPGVRSLPRILSEKEYKTGIIGKCHVETKDVYPFDMRTGERAGRNPSALGRNTREFIQSTNGSPFFLVVGFVDPHRAGAMFPQPSGRSGTSENIDKARLKLPDVLTDLPEVRQDYAAYLESVNNLDRCVGAVMDALDESGVTTSTLIIFVSDNGIPFPGSKTNLYDAGIHLPMIVCMPSGQNNGSVADAMVSWVDVAPTILDWIGVKDIKGMQGRSFLPVLKDPKAKGWDQIFASHTFHEITMYYPMRCIRTRDYKLIWNLAHQLPYPIAGDIRRSPSWEAIQSLSHGKVGGRTMEQYLHRPEFELYDLRKDPMELLNLSQNPAQQDTLEYLKGELLKMMRNTKDPWLSTVEDTSQ